MLTAPAIKKRRTTALTWLSDEHSIVPAQSNTKPTNENDESYHMQPLPDEGTSPLDDVGMPKFEFNSALGIDLGHIRSSSAIPKHLTLEISDLSLSFVQSHLQVTQIIPHGVPAMPKQNDQDTLVLLSSLSSSYLTRVNKNLMSTRIMLHNQNLAVTGKEVSLDTQDEAKMRLEWDEEILKSEAWVDLPRLLKPRPQG